MRYSILNRFLMVLLIQHNTPEGLSTPNEFPADAAAQDGQSLPQEPEMHVAETVPFVSPLSLKVVQQAMQEASEQVKGRGATEVLKELLEKVVEATLGQAEADGQAEDMDAEKEDVQEDALGVKKGESEAGEEAETLKLPLEEKMTSLDIGDDSFVESKVVAGIDGFKNVAGGGKELVTEEGIAVVRSVEEMGVREAVGLDVTSESLLETKSTREDVDGASEETEGDLEDGKKDSEEQVVLIVLKNATERETQDGEETPATVEVAVGVQPEKDTEEESKAGLRGTEEEQIENSRRNKTALHEISLTDQTGVDKTLPHPDDHAIQIKPVLGQTKTDKGEFRNGVIMDGLENVYVNGLAQVEQDENTDVKGTDLREGIVKANYGEVEIKEGSEAVVVEGGDNVRGEEKTALKDSEHKKEDQGRNEKGLEGWKIGTIFTAVFMVLETVVILIYVLKCRNSKSTTAPQHTCEEGCVEPEAATAGDCSDETLPAENRNLQEYVAS